MMTKVSWTLLGATTEVAALKKALAEAEDKAAKESATREKHKARVSEVQQELQDAVKKYESLERDSKTQASELAKARQSAQDARAEAQSALQEIQAAKKMLRVRLLLCKESLRRKRSFYLPEFGALQGRLQICRAAYQMLPSSIEPNKGLLRRSCSGLNILDLNIWCPSVTI